MAAQPRRYLGILILAPLGIALIVVVLAVVFLFLLLASPRTKSVAWSYASLSIPRTVDIPCGSDVDAKINTDPGTTPSRFVLGSGCTFSASALLRPKTGDQIACEKDPTFTERPPALDPQTYCTINGSSLVTVMKPQGSVMLEGIAVEGGKFTGSTGSGVGIAAGGMLDSSKMFGIEVRNTEGAGISSANGTLSQIELTNTTTNPRALGFIGSGVKAVDEFYIDSSYIHDNQGNGIWCDVECNDTGTDSFVARDNLVMNNGRAGIRYERVGMESSHGEAMIYDNIVRGNATQELRGGIDIRDAQDAEVFSNVFGENGGNLGVRATDSGRSTRPDLKNVIVRDNTMNSDDVRTCGGVVTCSGNN
jgi:hypothetical protein